MRYIYISVMLLLTSGVCFIVFVMFNYAFYNDTSGLFNLLDASAQNTMNTNYYNWFDAKMILIGKGFGFASLATFISGIISAILLMFYEHSRPTA